MGHHESMKIISKMFDYQKKKKKKSIGSGITNSILLFILPYHFANLGSYATRTLALLLATTIIINYLQNYHSLSNFIISLLRACTRRGS